MIIEVSQNDIDRGVPQSPCWCPLARAFFRLGARDILVGFGADMSPVISLRDKRWGRLREFRAPRWVADKIMAFDQNMIMEPFDFPVEEVP